MQLVDMIDSKRSFILEIVTRISESSLQQDPSSRSIAVQSFPRTNDPAPFDLGSFLKPILPRLWVKDREAGRAAGLHGLGRIYGGTMVVDGCEAGISLEGLVAPFRGWTATLS